MREYFWDPRDKLSAASVNGTTVSSYSYHPLSDLIYTRREPGESRRVTYWDGENLLAEASLATGTYDLAPERYYASLEGYDEIESQGDTAGAAPFYPLRDALLSVHQLTSSTGTVAATYGYSAYGEARGWTDPNAQLSRLTYTGREWDTGVGAYYYRARWYQPQTSRYVSSDPYVSELLLQKRIKEPELLWTRYTYTGGRPTMFGDPTGLKIANTPPEPLPPPPLPPPPPGSCKATPNDDACRKKCADQYDEDAETCRSLKTRKARALCWAAIMVVYSACLKGCK